MVLGGNREAPDLGTGGFLPSAEDDIIILVKYSDGYFFEDNTAVVVTQFSDSHHVVMEVRQYITSLGGELQEDQVT